MHGSEASEEDVATVFRSQNPAAVVLELCPSRFESMQAEEAKYQSAIIKEDKQLKAAARETGRKKHAASIVETAPAPAGTTAATSTLSKVVGGLAEWGSNLHTFSKQHGPMQTVLVALLSSSAEVQRVLTTSSSTSSGSSRRRRRASCEFRTSVELAEEGKAAIVLGDQDLSITLGRFKEGIWQWGTQEEKEEGEGQARGRGQQALREFASIRDALLGPSDLPRTQRVDVLRLLFTQERYIREVIKVLVPVGLVVLVALRAVETVGDAAIASLNQVLPSLPSSSAVDFMSSFLSSTTAGDAAAAAAAAAAAVAAPSLLDAEWVSNLGWGGLNAFMLLYFVAINRYILVERDLFLADSIAEASLKGVHKGKKVAAVVGLLHGNGVARHLREKHGFVLVDRP